MKIAITTHGKDHLATVDGRFGRAPNFLIFDQDTEKWECVPNTQNLEAAHGAGIQAGQTIAKSGAKVLITGHVGPKAFKVLEAAGVEMYTIGQMTGAVDEILAAFLAGKLKVIDTPKPMGHGKL